VTRARPGLLLLGFRGGIAGTVYGTIVVMAVIAASSKSAAADPRRAAILTGGTVVVLWLAHVYSHALAESLTDGHRLAPATLRAIARREAAIPLAAVLPLTALALGVFDVVPERVAIRLALGIGVLTLAVLGVRYARVERLGATATLLTVAINVVLGLLIVALEVAVAH
jgi:hypothetical protein